MRRLALGTVLLLTSAAAAHALEVPPISPAEFAVAPEAHWLWTLLASDTMVNIWLWLTTSGVALLIGWLKWKGSRKEQALLCLAAGVRETYEHYVRHIKQSREDGKLTDDEREEAVRQAVAHAKRYAMTEGFDLLKVLAKDLLPVWVDALVRRFKGEAKGTAAPLSPPLLPDLSPSRSSGA